MPVNQWYRGARTRHGMAGATSSVTPAISLMKMIHKKILFSLVLTLVLSELALRAYSYLHPSVLAYNPSQYRKFKARPGDLSYGFPINSDGFKDQPFSTQRVSGERRVAAIGDSFVFSMVPYESSFCTVLEKRLQNVNVMNFGVIGTKPEDYVTVLRNDTLRYEPDAVVLFIYVGNDFLLTRNKWYDYSALATVLHHTSKALQAYNGQDIRQNYTYDDNMTPFSYADFISTESKYAETYYLGVDRFRKEFDRTMKSVYAMRDICAEHRIRFRVVVLPDRIQMEPDLQADVARNLQMPVSAFDYMRPQRMLAKTLTAQHIPFVDLYSPLADAPERKFINHDIHFNIYGNRLVAELLPEDWFKND